MKRLIGLLTCVHRVHHIYYGYGYVFLPLMLAHFGDPRMSRPAGWKFVQPKHFHDCTWTGIN